MSETGSKYEQEQQARQQLKARFVRVAAAVARELAAKEPGSRWRVESVSEGREYVTLINADERARSWEDDAGANYPERVRLAIDVYDKAPRITARGLYGKRLDGQRWTVSDYRRKDWPENPQPTMSLDKTPAQLAADVSRRLLGNYRWLLHHYREHYAQSCQYADSKRATAAQLIADGLGAVRSWGEAWQKDDPASLSLIVRGVEGVSGEVEVSSGDRVQVSLRLTAERARELLVWLALRPRERPETDGSDD